MKLEPNAIRSRVNKLASKSRTGLEIVGAEPKLAINAIAAFGASYLRTTKSPKILVGTHHKVLTAYMSRVFRAFARFTKRSISIGMAEDVDYTADVIFDNHSQFDFSKLDCEYVGIHFRRDPRDLVVSAGFYHKRSGERQLHVPSEEFGGKTYQEYVNAMESMEDVFLFELDHSAGMNIRQMIQWDYARGFLELKYEDLVTPEGGQVFRQAVDRWPLSTLEKSLLGGLFDYYSVFGGGGKKTHHARDPRSKQFEEYFSEKLHREFDARFADGPSKLGYE
jgi:hypothetical protein